MTRVFNRWPFWFALHHTSPNIQRFTRAQHIQPHSRNRGMGKYFADKLAELVALAALATQARRALDTAVASGCTDAAHKAASEKAAHALSAVAQAAGSDSGVAVEVSLYGGKWLEAVLLGRTDDSTWWNPRWFVFFYETAAEHILRFANNEDEAQVWFPLYAQRGRVQVKMGPPNGKAAWVAGMCVQCAPGDVEFGVMFDNGGFSEGLDATQTYMRKEAAKPPRSGAVAPVKQEGAAAVAPVKQEEAEGAAAVAPGQEAGARVAAVAPVKQEQVEGAAAVAPGQEAGAGGVVAKNAKDAQQANQRASQEANERAAQEANQRASQEANERVAQEAKDAKDAKRDAKRAAKRAAAEKVGEAGGAFSSGGCGRPLRAETARNIDISYSDKRAKKANGRGGAAGAGASAPAAQKWAIERVAGVKKINGALYYKIRWSGYGSEHDSWERGTQLSRDTSVEYLRGLVKDYDDPERDARVSAASVRAVSLAVRAGAGCAEPH